MLALQHESVVCCLSDLVRLHWTWSTSQLPRSAMFPFAKALYDLPGHRGLCSNLSELYCE